MGTKVNGILNIAYSTTRPPDLPSFPTMVKEISTKATTTISRITIKPLVVFLGPNENRPYPQVPRPNPNLPYPTTQPLPNPAPNQDFMTTQMSTLAQINQNLIAQITQLQAQQRNFESQLTLLAQQPPPPTLKQSNQPPSP